VEFNSFFNPQTGLDISALWIDMNEASKSAKPDLVVAALNHTCGAHTSQLLQLSMLQPEWFCRR